MLRRTARSILVTLLALGLLVATGCTSEGSGGSSAASGQTHLSEILKRGTVRVAVLPDFPPWSSQTASGEFKGYEVDIAHKLAEALGVKLKLVPTDGTSRLPLLKTDRVDVNISAWTATNERARAVGFTIPYIAHGACVLYRKDNPIKGYDDLAGKKVSVARGSTNDIIMTEDFPKTEVVRFKSIADVIAALKAGKVDAAVEGCATVNQQAEQNKNLKRVDAPTIQPSIVSMGVLPQDQVWLNYLNNFIRNLNTSGTNAKLYRKWFEGDIPDVMQ